MKYLIIDDNENIRHLIRQMVCSEDDITIECSNGEDAFNLYRNQKPDYVLMDIQMPGMDGIKVTEKIVKSFPEAKIIIITEFDSPAFRTASMKAGAVSFVSKENLIEVKNFIFNHDYQTNNIGN